MMEGPDALSVVLRALSLILMLTAAGISIFIEGFGRLMPDGLPRVRKLGWNFALAALVFLIAHQAVEPARLAGDMSGMTDPAMLRLAVGAAFSLRMTALVMLIWHFSRPPVPWAGIAVPLVATVAITASFAQMGHTVTTPHHLAAAALLILHLLVVAFWLGSLWPLYVAAKNEPPAVAARVVDTFSQVAAWLVPVILLAGIALTALLLPSLDTFKQPYGQLLLAKVAGFAILMALAALNKWHFGPDCAAGDTAAFKRTVIIEYALICAVLTATAVMTTFFSPEAA